MSAPIGVGDWVECIDASHWEHPDLLVLGGVYQIESISTFVAVTLVGVQMPPPYLDFYLSRFRPIYRPSESLFLTRLMYVPAPEREDA